MSSPNGEGSLPPSASTVARLRAVRRAVGGSAAEGLPPVRTRRGAVHIAKIETHEEGGRSWVDVHLAGRTEGGDPHFRIVNPPTLASDPNGDIEVNGQRFRHDPVAAIAEVIASLGGAQESKGRRRR